MTLAKSRARALAGAFLAASSYLDTLCTRCYKPGHIARNCRRIRKNRKARRGGFKDLDGALSFIIEQGEKRRLAREKEDEDGSTIMSGNMPASADMGGKPGSFGATGTGQNSGFGGLSARVNEGVFGAPAVQGNKGGKPAANIFKAAGTSQTSIFDVFSAPAVNKGNNNAADIFKARGNSQTPVFNPFSTPAVNKGNNNAADIFKARGNSQTPVFNVFSTPAVNKGNNNAADVFKTTAAPQKSVFGV
ncbi:hypothetical protein J3458_002333 [Metarhizium acridum]|uniref:uncharacterized protein n=1 Tax=Metarhizium acridum TaxID=92637 RepID=UPI001C6ADD9D|nr:hypothetical protein J3458_002333 [Metarhizium acridum]